MITHSSSNGMTPPPVAVAGPPIPGFAQRLREMMARAGQSLHIDRREGLIVLPGLRSSATLTLGMLRLREAFELPEALTDGLSVRLDVACGASDFSEDGEDALFLVQSARIAALVAAQRGGGSALAGTRYGNA